MDEVITLPDGRAAQYWDNGLDGPAVLFFHGCPDTRHAAVTGAGAAAALGVRLVAVNRPGYGRSDRHDSTQSSVADDAVAVVDALGLADFAARGMSVGTAYALVCAARHPARVRSLALVAAPPQEERAWTRPGSRPGSPASTRTTSTTGRSPRASSRRSRLPTPRCSLGCGRPPRPPPRSGSRWPTTTATSATPG